jgi:hypothetical protein
MRGRIWKRLIGALVCAASVSLMQGPIAATPTPDMPQAGSGELERIKSLAGAWQGTSTGHGEEQAAQVSYQVTAGGSAVIETLFAGTPHEMVSVYHDRNGRLSMTHYCMLRNQPELVLRESRPDQLVLDLSEQSDIDAASQHMHRLVLTFPDAYHLTHEWTLYGNGEAKDTTTITLSRVR